MVLMTNLVDVRDHFLLPELVRRFRDGAMLVGEVFGRENLFGGAAFQEKRSAFSLWNCNCRGRHNLPLNSDFRKSPQRPGRRRCTLLPCRILRRAASSRAGLSR